MSVPTCPTCHCTLEGPMSEWPRFPFCSRKCKLIDLGRWFDERYGLPAEEPDDLPADDPEGR